MSHLYTRKYYILLLMMIPLIFLLSFSYVAMGKSKDSFHMKFKHLIISGEGTTLKIYEIITFENPANQNLPEKITFTSTLPQGATNLVFEKAEELEQLPKGFTATFDTGDQTSTDISYSYEIPDFNSDRTLSFTQNYDVDTLNILIPAAMNLSIASERFTTNEPVTINDNTYKYYTAKDVKAEEPLDIQFLLKPATDDMAGMNMGGSTQPVISKQAPQFHNPGHIRVWYQSPLRSMNPHIFLIILGVVVISGIALYIRYRMMEQERLEASRNEKDDLFDKLLLKQKVLMQKIVEMDEAHQKGNIPESVYRDKRNAYKEQLIHVKLQLRELTE
ncbi:hypothetical protein L1765_14445 [Microaerobacter geothermalis]|uniref:hypothetical protein n=1 Tax=Microaerobacter geothermalis TaxID=674972 RepID=UPI001F33E311|nr:hypothetical protein [Microaerobacter geothermalis]MCF6095160.1 hypothetical protein [Microaerobacter geothermalis]